MAVFNNGYPATYQNPYLMQQPQYVQQPQPQQSGVIWIQGEAAAKSYLVAPNTTVALWDTESQTVYLKSADASGMPSMRILDYTIRGVAPTTPVAIPASDYATKSDLDALKNQLEGLRMKLGKLTKKEADNE